MEMITAFQCFVVAYVYCELLIREGMLFSKPFQWLAKKLTITKTEALLSQAPKEVQEMPGYEEKYITHIHRKEHWLLKIIGGCVYCTTGQLTLWVLLYQAFAAPHLPQTFTLFIAQTATIIFAVSFSLLLVIFFKKNQ